MTILVAVGGVLLAAVAAVGALLGEVTVDRHRAAAVADAAALSGAAHVLEEPLAACRAAAAIAARNDANIQSCTVRDGVVTVVARVDLSGPIHPFGPALGRARAEQIPTVPNEPPQGSQRRNLDRSTSLSLMTTSRG